MNRVTQTLVGPAPHIRARQSTFSLAWGTSILLVPAFLWGLYCFGFDALIPVTAAVLSAIAGELVIGLVYGSLTIADGTAFLTGFLIGLSMPPGVPLYIPIVSALFAICLVKGAFGGLGANWMNPALAGVVFALLNWPNQMDTWKWPKQLASVSGISGATPLGLVRTKLMDGGGGSASDILENIGYRVSSIDQGVTTFFNDFFFRFLGAKLPMGIYGFAHR